jgi:hypothetical protein
VTNQRHAIALLKVHGPFLAELIQRIAKAKPETPEPALLI